MIVIIIILIFVSLSRQRLSTVFPKRLSDSNSPSGLHNSPGYSGRFQQCCSFDGLNSSFDFQFF